MEGENNLMDRDILDYTNNTIIPAMDSMGRHLLVIQMISVRHEGGKVPGLNRPLTQSRSRPRGVGRVKNTVFPLVTSAYIA